MINRRKISSLVACSLAITTIFGMSIPKNVTAVETADSTSVSTEVSSGSAVESSSPESLSEILSDIKSGNEFENYSVFLKDSSLMQLGNDIKTNYALEYVNITDPTLANIPVVSMGRVSEKHGLSASIKDELFVSDLNKIINPKRGLHLYKVTGEDLINILEWTASLYDTEEVYDKVVLSEDEADKSEESTSGNETEDKVNTSDNITVLSVSANASNEDKTAVLSAPDEVSDVIDSTVLNAPAVVESNLKAENTVDDTDVLNDADNNSDTEAATDDAVSEDANESQGATPSATPSAVASESAVPGTEAAVKTATPSATDEAEPEETEAAETVAPGTEAPAETTKPATSQAVKVYNLFEYDLQTVLDNYFVLDGINYTIDLKGSSLFDDEGNKIDLDEGETGRIKNVNVNGKEIQAGDTFILAAETVPALAVLGDMNAKKLVDLTPTNYRNYAKSYIDLNGDISDMIATVDNNYKVVFGISEEDESVSEADSENGGNSSGTEEDSEESKSSSGENATKKAKASGTSETEVIDGFIKIDDIYLPNNDTFTEENGYSFVKVEDNYTYKNKDKSEIKDSSLYRFVEENVPKARPNLFCINLTSGSAYLRTSLKIVVYAENDSNIIKVNKGRYNAGSAIWNNIPALTSNIYKANENAVYSIFVSDSDGDGFVNHIRVSNISENELGVPVVNPYSNTSTRITGQAEAEMTVVFETGNIIYKTTSDASGNFSYAMPYQKAGTKINVYVTDNDGKTSDKVTTEVLRNGPNCPSVGQITTKSRNISGNINDTSAFPAVLVNEKDLYVASNGGRDFYTNSAFYNAGYSVTDVDVSVDSEGTYSLDLPKTLTIEDTVKIYSFDVMNRVSLPATGDVILVKPKKPTFDANTVNNKVKKVKVYSDELCKMTLTMKGKTYTNSNGKYKPKTFNYCYKFKLPRTDSGVKIKVYATNDLGNSKTASMKRTEVVPNKPVITGKNSETGSVSGKIDLVGNTNGKKATVKNTKSKVYVFFNGKKHKAKLAKNGTFTYTSKAMRGLKKVYVKAKNLNGYSMKAKI
ncbi:MAG: hypothetical protein K6G11_00115 [Lachnospiraceae bacterium]|nr:hypothetical protein [Lachnospiraceae bacterium]